MWMNLSRSFIRHRFCESTSLGGFEFIELGDSSFCKSKKEAKILIRIFDLIFRTRFCVAESK